MATRSRRTKRTGRSAHSLQSGVDGRKIEGIGIETGGNPIHVLLVLLVVRVPDRFEDHRIHVSTPDVLGWARPLAFETHRELEHQIQRAHRLDDHLVAPVVPEVVLVFESRPLSHHFGQPHRLVVDVGHLELRVGDPIANTVNLEAVQVIVLPAHRRLEDRVQFRHGDASGNKEASPDHRDVILQRDAQLEGGLADARAHPCRLRDHAQDLRWGHFRWTRWGQFELTFPHSRCRLRAGTFEARPAVARVTTGWRWRAALQSRCDRHALAVPTPAPLRDPGVSIGPQRQLTVVLVTSPSTWIPDVESWSSSTNWSSPFGTPSMSSWRACHSAPGHAGCPWPRTLVH